MLRFERQSCVERAVCSAVQSRAGSVLLILRVARGLSRLKVVFGVNDACSEWKKQQTKVLKLVRPGA